MSVSSKRLNVFLTVAMFVGMATPSHALNLNPIDAGNTPITAVYGNTMPAAEKLAIYQTTAQFYLDKIKKTHPALLTFFDDYMMPTEDNKGDPEGYRTYLAYIARYAAPDAPGGADKKTVYDLVSEIARYHLEKTKSQNPH